MKSLAISAGCTLALQALLLALTLTSAVNWGWGLTFAPSIIFLSAAGLLFLVVGIHDHA